jgi:hypothetical protein
MLRLISTVVLAAVVLLPIQAQAQDVRRACRATGYFMFTFNEHVDGSVVTRTRRIDIRQADMEVVANSAGQTWSTVTDAKRWACAQAAECFVRQAAGADSCGGSPLKVVYETIRKPDPIDDWRRQVACSHARAGSVPGLRNTGANTVTLVQTKIVATASRDGITRNADTTVSESDHVCWSPSEKPGGRPSPGTRPTPGRQEPKPTRTDPDHQPKRTDPGHQPSRTDSSRQPTRTDSGHAPSRTNAPSPIATIKVTVTPRDQKGKCPASVLMQARLELRKPAEVRWWVTGEDGYESPKYVRSFTSPDASLVWRRHIDPKPTTGGLTQAPGGKPRAPIHRGYFQVHFETVSDQGRAIPLGESNRVPFTVDCNPAPPNRIKR